MVDKALTLELAQTYQKGQRALNQLIEHHTGLARTWAIRFRRQEQCCELDDLFQEARRGLIDAAGHFDPNRGAFSTCAGLWMKKRLLGFIDKSKQFGPQPEKLDLLPDESVGRVLDMEIDTQKVAARIKHLQRAGILNERDGLVIRAMIASDDERDDVLRPLFAQWYRNAVCSVLRKVRTGKARTRQKSKVQPPKFTNKLTAVSSVTL